MKNLYYSTLFCFFIISTTTYLVFASRLLDDLTICGRKTTTNNRKILNSGDYGRIFVGNLTKTTCKLELLACQNCLIELNWRLESDFLTNFDDKCDFGASSNTKIAAGAEISVLEERPSDEFLQPKCRKYPIFYQNSTIKNAGEGEISKNFTSSINKLILITFSTLGEKSINFPVIEFKVIENTVIFRAWALYDPNSNSTSNSIGVITSPWYPKSYPQNIVVNYTFINENPIGGVQLLFSDYQLHYMSSIKIFDSDGTVIHGATSANDYSVTRPCSVSSSGPKLTLLFSSGPYATDIGFRAEYKFTLRAHWPNNPVCKTCDKIYDQKAGVIILDPSLINTPNIYIDCIWLVSKSRFSSPLYDQIYLKIRDLSILKHSHKNLSFEIRQGLTSQSPLLFHYGTSSLINNYDDSDYSIQFPIVNDSFVLNLPDGRTTGYEKCGFYIRLKGFYLGGIGVALIFTQFYKWANAVCNDAREYHCANGRCIAGNLQCDENDHCGDYSDELPNLCFNMKEITSSDILLQNQYIKKYLVETESSPSINAGGAYATTIILISCIIGLIIVLLIVTVVAGKIYRQRLAALQHQLRAPIVEDNSREVGSVPGPSIHQMGERRLFVWPAATANAATRVFEAPPTYDDALKHPTVPLDGVVNEAFVAMEESEASTPIEGAATTLPSTQIASESGPDSGTLNNSGTLV